LGLEIPFEIPFCRRRYRMPRRFIELAPGAGEKSRLAGQTPPRCRA